MNHFPEIHVYGPAPRYDRVVFRYTDGREVDVTDWGISRIRWDLAARDLPEVTISLVASVLFHDEEGTDGVE
jgi:hypothetical protein